MSSAYQLAPYQSLAAVYDAWTARNDYPLWASFITDELRARGGATQTVLDLCCGTGRLTALLQQAGFAVAGVDRSAEMLARARERLGEAARIYQAELPYLPLDTRFDAAVCTFDSINYLVGDGALAACLATVERVLLPGGVFIFDVNTRRKLEDVFGSSHYGDDLGDFAYVWRNRYDPATRRITFRITLFRRRGEHFMRYEEVHTQRWFSHDEIRAAAAAAGLVIRDVRDDYGAATATADTLRETWVLQRTGSGA